ncbi:hypothetical protein PROVRUST_04554 [Providencia rustigianii DSM 4541]|uniref:Uncharacterized protein n=1 Tax=Providencia rustigianii DSM 4541 TaxID=500637 RepID=D1NXC5_9GAMM|nr:hypothetical protein PROVRUST_04554 [Providencia rustigianii DSM 4541]
MKLPERETCLLIVGSHIKLFCLGYRDAFNIVDILLYLSEF